MTALVWVATDLRAILAAHVAFQLMDRRRLRATHDVEGDGLVVNWLRAEAPWVSLIVAGILA